jgi:hypothetical protein
MKSGVLSATLAATTLAAMPSAPAADFLQPPISKTFTMITPKVQRAAVRVRIRPAVVTYRKVGVRIGMPCLLPPDVIVARNWNGPQCRYEDNIMPGDWLHVQFVRPGQYGMRVQRVARRTY